MIESLERYTRAEGIGPAGGGIDDKAESRKREGRRGVNRKGLVKSKRLGELLKRVTGVPARYRKERSSGARRGGVRLRGGRGNKGTRV